MANSVDPDETAHYTLFAKISVQVYSADRVKWNLLRLGFVILFIFIYFRGQPLYIIFLL